MDKKIWMLIWINDKSEVTSAHMHTQKRKWNINRTKQNQAQQPDKRCVIQRQEQSKHICDPPPQNESQCARWPFSCFQIFWKSILCYIQWWNPFSNQRTSGRVSCFWIWWYDSFWENLLQMLKTSMIKQQGGVKKSCLWPWNMEKWAISMLHTKDNLFLNQLQPKSQNWHFHTPAANSMPLQK